jgi:hypothetical protein
MTKIVEIGRPLVVLEDCATGASLRGRVLLETPGESMAEAGMERGPRRVCGEGCRGIEAETTVRLLEAVAIAMLAIRFSFWMIGTIVKAVNTEAPKEQKPVFTGVVGPLRHILGSKRRKEGRRAW